jgi:hypothetical protein
MYLNDNPKLTALTVLLDVKSDQGDDPIDKTNPQWLILV